ncbi:hypothetical protein PIB30_086349 [Stylosanthes scabra]|uniref:Uncharacterized protein n=1 Tax=Stylosanthes scabra TaxID=79078 RepID=A0ABU6QVG0_9FABA|nr:hypothetical protein [Stylosanthes scabra]
MNDEDGWRDDGGHNEEGGAMRLTEEGGAVMRGTARGRGQGVARLTEEGWLCFNDKGLVFWKRISTRVWCFWKRVALVHDDFDLLRKMCFGIVIWKAYQNGQIGITLVTHWMEPKSNSAADRKAAKRALDFWFGWYAHPITYGDYPESMRSLVGSRLPKFKKNESENVKGSYDFLGVNYYTTNFAENEPSTNTVNKSFLTDMHTILSSK